MNLWPTFGSPVLYLIYMTYALGSVSSDVNILLLSQGSFIAEVCSVHHGGLSEVVRGCLRLSESPVLKHTDEESVALSC